jgi:hypothetical protein
MTTVLKGAASLPSPPATRLITMLPADHDAK